MNCGVGRRHGLDPELLWLWCRPAATALIGPLAWEPPYAAIVALEKAKRPPQKKNKNKIHRESFGLDLCRRLKVHPKELKAGTQLDTYTLVGSAAVFTTAGRWKPPKHPSTDEWVTACGLYMWRNIIQP